MRDETRGDDAGLRTVDPARMLLALVIASACGVGLPAGLADEDFEGDPRDASPHVGADER